MASNPLIQELIQGGLVWPGSNSSSLSPKAQQKNDNSFLQTWLRSGEVHEWSLSSDLCSERNRIWFAPLFLLSAVLNSRLLEEKNSSSAANPFISWIGKPAWPCPAALQHMTSETSSTPLFLFIDPKNKNDRLWATLTALRSPIVRSVVVDGSGFNFTSTRRLCLAARKSNSLCIIVRPNWEASRPSAAHTRWTVEPLAEPHNKEAESLCWLVELNRARGLGSALRWKIEIETTGSIQSKVTGPTHLPLAEYEQEIFHAAG